MRKEDYSLMKMRNELFAAFNPFYRGQEREKILVPVLFLTIVIIENSKIDISGELLRDGSDFAKIRTLCDLAELGLSGADKISVLGKKDAQYIGLAHEAISFLRWNYPDESIRYKEFVDRIMLLVTQKDYYVVKQLVSGKISNSDFYDDNSTSDSISVLVAELLDIKRDEVLFDACSSSGAFLSYCALDYPCDGYYGIDIDSDLCFVARIRMAILGVNNKIFKGDIFDDQIIQDMYNKIFCEMPLGVRIGGSTKLKIINEDPDSLTPMSSPEWGYVVRALRHLEKGGKMITILPNGCLNSIKDVHARKSLLRRGRIEAVIQLSAGAISSMSIPINIVVLSANNKSVKMIDGTSFCQALIGRRRVDIGVKKIVDLYRSDEENEYVRNINNDSLIENNSILLPERYNGDADVLNHLPNPQLLGDLAEEIFRGYQITSEERREMQARSEDRHIVRALTVSDIKNSTVSKNLERLRDDEEKLSRYYLRDGDIVLSAKGDKVKMAVVEIKNDELIFPSGSIVVVRLKEKYNPFYVCAYLNSGIGEIALSNLQTGSVIKSLNPRSLAQVKIPFPTKTQDQDLIAYNYRTNVMMINSYIERTEDLVDKNNTLFDGLCGKRG